MGLFGKSDKEKAREIHDEWFKLNMLSIMIPRVLKKCQADTDIAKAVDFAMKMQIYRISTTTDKGRIQDICHETILRVGLKLANELKDTFGESMETLDFTTELISIFDHTMKNVLDGINNGVCNVNRNSIDILVNSMRDETRTAQDMFMKYLDETENNS